MKLHFHRIVDSEWVKTTHRKARKAFGSEWTDADPREVVHQNVPPSIEDLIGTVGGMSILDAVDIITNSRQISDASLRSRSTVSTMTQEESPRTQTVAPPASQFEMRQAEVSIHIF
jgi:hypothetical protein